MSCLCLVMLARLFAVHALDREADRRGARRSMSSAGFGGVSGELALDVMNPNGFGVPLSGIDWQLSIGGTRAVTGTVQLSQAIPAKGVAPVTTSLSIGTSDAISVGSVMASGSRDYQHRRSTCTSRRGRARSTSTSRTPASSAGGASPRCVLPRSRRAIGGMCEADVMTTRVLLLVALAACGRRTSCSRTRS